ncbi:hypothetical protein F8S13_23130 [Chloroflexia bacterium SDU3-3]|nr:hypothetical protein F8S13_23130 [Chloroflexia bacterium SDU3-3]
MTPFVMWDEDNKVEVKSVEDIKILMDQIFNISQGELPISIEMYLDEQKSMYIVIGSNRSPVGFICNADNPLMLGAYSSHLEGAGYFTFNHRGHYSVVQMEYTIPVDDAKMALLHFFETGNPKDGIVWQ